MRRGLTGYVNDLYNRLEIFKDTAAIVRVNPATLKPPLFFMWLRDNYVVTISMAIRRLLDAREDVVSLGRLLREIEVRPELLSREHYRAQASKKHKLAADLADGNYERRVGVFVDHITTAYVAGDIARLEEAESKIRQLVNKRFAHAAPLEKLDEPPTLGDIENAIEEIDQIFVKYDALISAGGLTTAHSAKLNWKPPLEIPWIEPGKRGEIPKYGGPKHHVVR